jgi:hypothetical protein
MCPFGEERTGQTFSPAPFYVEDRPERFEEAFAGNGSRHKGWGAVRVG